MYVKFFTLYWSRTQSNIFSVTPLLGWPADLGTYPTLHHTGQGHTTLSELSQSAHWKWRTNNKQQTYFQPFQFNCNTSLRGEDKLIHFGIIFLCCKFNSQVMSYFTYLIYLQNSSFAVNREKVYWIFKRHRQCVKDNGMWFTLPQKFLSVLLSVTFEGRNLLPHGL